MKKTSLFKRAISTIALTALTVTSILGTAPLTAMADVSTSVGDSTVTGTGTATSVMNGSWCCDYDSPTFYSVGFVIVPNPYATSEDVVLGENSFYTFSDLQLFTTNNSKTDNAYYFSSATTRCANKLGSMTLNTDGSYDFSEALGVSLNLPNQGFSATNPTYNSVSNELSSKIITAGNDANILDIISNYISYLDSHQDRLSDNGRTQLSYLKSMSGYGTDSFSTNAVMLGLTFEVGSFTMGKAGYFAASYRNLIDTQIGNDAYFVWRVMNDADKAGSYLNWNATHTDTGRRYSGAYTGQAVFLAMNDQKVSKTNYSQSSSITLSYNGELKSNTDSSDIQSSWGTVTSAKNPDVNLGDGSYTGVLDNAYDNSLTNTSIALNNGSTLDTSNEADSLNTLSGKSDYSGLNLNKYDVLKVAVDGDVDLSSLGSVDIASALNGVSAKTKTNAISGGFGNTYKLSFEGSSTVRSNVASKLSNLGYASAVSSYNSLTQKGSITNMKDLQSSALLAGKIEGSSTDSGLSNAKGNEYVTISYLSKDKQVTSKNAEVYIDSNASVSSVKAIDSKTYSVSNSVTWDIEKKSKTYAYTLAWKASDYDLTNEVALTNAMLQSLGETYVLRGNAGVSTLSKAFRNATGKEVLGVKYMEDTSSISVGASSDTNSNIVGVHTLTILVSQELPMNVSSTDYVDSNELNFVYSDLRGYKSTINTIAPMSAYLTDVVYPYTVSDNNSGDLISFKGANVHYYFEPTGLFGVYANSVKSMNRVSYPSYAYNLSRGLWGDSLVASNYRGLSSQDDSIRNDIINNLGLSVGATGNISSVTAGENVDGTISTKKSDKYKFTANITRKWYSTETNADGSTYQQEHTETVEEHNNYSITHSLNKYTCAALDTALNTGANKAAFNIKGQNNLGNKVTMVTQSSKTLTVYPEVAYKYYQTSVSNGVLNSVKPLTVYVMGEKARTMQPSSLRGIDMDYNYGSNVADGKVVSDGASVGSDSYSMSDGKMVLTSGTNITMSANHSVDYRLISYSLDVVDQYNGASVRNEFSPLNADYDPADEHESYVKSFMDNVVVDTYMTIGTKEYEMKTSNTAPVVKNATATTSISIKFKDRVIDSDSKTSIIDDMVSEYSISNAEATQMFESAGFEKQLQAMFESNISSYNNSKNKWYDEESVTLCIRKYVTTVDLKQVLVQDKVDYNAVGAVDINTNKAVDGVFTMSVSLPESFFSCNLANANKLFEKQTIKGTEFKVTSASTHDFIK